MAIYGDRLLSVASILIVDDDDLALDMLELALEEGNHEVIRATCGQDALEILRSDSVNMVISDWAMPEMDGIELTRKIRAIDLGRYIYIVLLTGYNTPDATVSGLVAGADDFIAKPFNPQELVVRVRAGERVLSLETRDLALFAMAKLAESRDPETGKHLERVQSYCRVIAYYMSCLTQYNGVVDSTFVQQIHSTSPLHDIGKVAIPDRVLLKPGRFTDDEFEIMKVHTIAGASTLDESIKRFPGHCFLEMARDIAIAHHEKFDGTGYPYRIGGKDIPIAARIVSIADVYDALTSKRVYKEAFSHEKAKAIIVDGADTHFDPDIVNAFLQNETQFQEISREFREDPNEVVEEEGWRRFVLP